MKNANSKKRNRIILIVTALVVILGLFLISPLYPYVRSLAVMSVYSKMCEKEGLPAKEGVSIHIPGGASTKETDWYPFVLTFHDDSGFAGFSGIPGAELTILYNFPAFP